MYSGSENLFLINLRNLLESIAEELRKLANWRFWIDRPKVLNDLQRCERELNSFHQDFTVRVQGRSLRKNELHFFLDDTSIGN